jgi:hypothetical protein
MSDYNTFPDSPVPNKSTVSRLVNRFRDTGSVQDRNRSSRPSVLRDESLVDIRQTLLLSPWKSLRELPLKVGLSYGSVQDSISWKICGFSALHILLFWLLPFHHILLILLEIWCAVSRQTIIGSIFFIEMATAERYQEIIVNLISLLEVDEQDCWYQQDGATVPTEISTMQMLSEFFGGRIISRNFWPPPSPDLSPSDFHLWGFLKENVYKNNPHTLEELKRNIELCISNVTAETVHRVASDMRKRVNACITKRGGHFQHLI